MLDDTSDFPSTEVIARLKAWQDVAAAKPAVPTTGKLPPAQPEVNFSELRQWVKDNLSGKQRRVMELTIECGGECPLSTIAIDAKVGRDAPYDDAFNGIRKAVNPKLKRAALGWKLERHDNNARLAQLGQK